MTFSLIMPAAGSGARLGAALPKALIEIAGVPLFVHAIRPFVSHAACREVVVAAPESFEMRFREIVAREFAENSVRIVTGGATRQESVNRALAESSAGTPVVMVHDAARPLVSSLLVERVLDGLENGFAAVVPGLPVTDTIKRGGGEPVTVESTIDRENVYCIQTPQAIRCGLLLKAFALANEKQITLSDDAGLIEYFGLGRVRIVAGDPDNFKITTLSDLTRAAKALDRRS